MKRFFTALFISVIILAGCVSITRYDKDTYKFLTFRKADVVELYNDKVTEDKAAWNVRAEIILEDINRMLEYETNKIKNKDTAKQFKLLKEIYVSHINDKDWDELETELYLETIILAFDGLIDTENSKNRGSFF